jgi:phosphoesterase RecJ-like protein
MENNLTFFDVGILNEAIYTLTTSDMEYKFKEAETMIKEAKRVFLIRHLSPDKDAFGAVNSLAAEIKYRYKTKEVRLIQEKTIFDGDFTEDDLVIFLDVSSYGRLGISKNNLDYFKITGNKFKSIRIDHHSVNDIDPISSTLDIVDEKAGSTCELVTLFLKENDYPINKEIAELLFTGIISDTGRFQYSMSKTTLLAMAILSDAGVDHTEIYNKMYMKSPTMIKGKKFILDNYKISIL